MKILLLNQFFWPDSAATSQLLTDLARGLAGRGHQVYAVCAGAGAGYALKDFDDPPSAVIYRVASVPFWRGRIGRVLSYISYYLTCAVRGLTAPRPDVVVTLTTPPLLPLIGTLIKWLRGSKHFLWEMDLYPEVAVDVNYIRRGGLLDRSTGMLADLARRKSDGIIALGDCMRRRLMARGIPQEKIFVAENWADGELIRPVPRPAPQGEFVVLYSGNLGLAHDVDTIAEAMRELKQDARFRFVFAGGGPLRRVLEDRCRQRDLNQVDFKSYTRRAGLGESLGAGDVGLVTQRASCLGSVVPSKVYGLMAAGRPILFIGPGESTPAQVIQRFCCGWHVSNGDVAALVQLLTHLVANPAEVEEAGQRARQAFLEHYDRPLGVARICSLLGASEAEVQGAAA